MRSIDPFLFRGVQILASSTTVKHSHLARECLPSSHPPEASCEPLRSCTDNARNTCSWGLHSIDIVPQQSLTDQWAAAFACSAFNQSPICQARQLLLGDSLVVSAESQNQTILTFLCRHRTTTQAGLRLRLLADKEPSQAAIPQGRLPMPAGPVQ